MGFMDMSVVWYMGKHHMSNGIVGGMVREKHSMWYGTLAVWSMVRCRGYIIWVNTVYGMVCVDGMVREKDSTRYSEYMIWYVCGMVPWYGVVDVLYG